eukprot:m.105610 g.105610  ORF g.105610 m.105610 type:complete len:410 (+) comp14201_c2_seq2:1951-3180(+)
MDFCHHLHTDFDEAGNKACTTCGLVLQEEISQDTTLNGHTVRTDKVARTTARERARKKLEEHGAKLGYDEQVVKQTVVLFDSAHGSPDFRNLESLVAGCLYAIARVRLDPHMPRVSFARISSVTGCSREKMYDYYQRLRRAGKLPAGAAMYEEDERAVLDEYVERFMDSVRDAITSEARTALRNRLDFFLDMVDRLPSLGPGSRELHVAAALYICVRVDLGLEKANAILQDLVKQRPELNIISVQRKKRVFVSHIINTLGPTLPWPLNEKNFDNNLDRLLEYHNMLFNLLPSRQNSVAADPLPSPGLPPRGISIDARDMPEEEVRAYLLNESEKEALLPDKNAIMGSTTEEEEGEEKADCSPAKRKRVDKTEGTKKKGKKKEKKPRPAKFDRSALQALLSTLSNPPPAP